MSFGWSAGDILAAAEFILEVARALDEVDGSAKEFRTASSFLKNLNSALTPLEAFSALDTRPAYKKDIEREVRAIRVPVETFIGDVKDLQKNLGVEKEGRFRHFQNIPSKLKWHFSTSKKALVLQKEVEMHLTVINTLMQRLTVDMLHTLETEPKRDVGKSLEEKLNVHLPALQSTLLAELSQRNISNNAAWQKELKIMLENLLEDYFGSQKVHMRMSPSVDERKSRIDPSSDIDSSLVENLRSKFQSSLLENCRYPLAGIADDPEVTFRLQQWWGTPTSECIWIQTSRDRDERSLASDVIALSYAAEIPLAAYFCQRITPSGFVPSQMNQFIDLLSSLLYQVLNDHEGKGDGVETSGWSSLAGSTESIPDTLDFFQNAMELISGRLLIVIDDMDIIDNSEDPVLEEHVKVLLRILRNTDRVATVKVLLTTTNHSGMILDGVGWGSTVDASLSSGRDGFFAADDFKAVLDE